MKVLLVEDDRATSRFIARGLAEAGHAADNAYDGQTGLTMALAQDYDALIVDRMLPSMSGLDLIAALRTRGTETPILILTALDAVEDRVAGLEAGGDDYLVKPFAIQELEARVRALIRRERRQVSPEVLKVGDLVMDTATLRVTRAGQELTLSPIGLKLLNILMRDSPRVVSRRDIEREIWGDALPDSDTLRSHLYNLRKTIDKPFDKQLLHTVQSAGYRIADISQPPE